MIRVENGENRENVIADFSLGGQRPRNLEGKRRDGRGKSGIYECLKKDSGRCSAFTKSYRKNISKQVTDEVPIIGFAICYFPSSVQVFVSHIIISHKAVQKRDISLVEYLIIGQIITQGRCIRNFHDSRTLNQMKASNAVMKIKVRIVA